MSASPELARTAPEFSPRPTVRRPVEGHTKPGAPTTGKEGEGGVEHAAPAAGEEEEAAGCRTPTSERSKLPGVAAVCPPAPRKQPPARAVRCKRKLWTAEAELITVGAEEMERLFGWRVQQRTKPRKKKRFDAVNEELI